MNFAQKIAAVWQNVSIVQRALLMAVILAAGIACMALTYWVQRPDMGVLYSGIEVEEAAKITDKISEKNIIYKLGAGGTTIYVPKASITQLRLDMAKEGLPSNSQKGYGIFDDEKIGISPFVQNVNLKRALQDEIAKSIQMIDGVTNVRVHIVKPEHALFSSQREQTSASVVLRIKPGYKLSPSNIAAIAHMVAGSIEGLKSENVTIVDSQGQLLSNTSGDAMAGGGSGNVADYRERVEQNLGKKVEDMLAAVLGPGRAMVKISAEIDTTSSTVAKEIYDEGKRVPKKEEIKSQSETGARSSESGSGSTKKDETILTEYAVPKTVEQTVELAGEIKSLTVAAFVDLSPAEVAASGTDDKTKAAPASTAMIMEISQVEEIIKRAVGTKLAEDGLKVVNVKFNKPVETAEAEETSGLDYTKIAGQASLGIMAVCALLVLKMFTSAKNKAAASSSAGMVHVDSANNMAIASAENFDPSALRKKIVSSLQNNPEQVKQLFSSWLEDKRS